MTLEEAKKKIAKEYGRAGGLARANKSSYEQRKEWGKKGGRPPVDRINEESKKA